MEGEEWVIDTQVLVRGHHPTLEADLDAVAYINNVRTSHHIALDFQGEIQKEYTKYIKKHIPFRLWWEAMWKSNRVIQRDGLLGNRHRNQLLDDLHFDRDDLPFVAVASKGISKFLVADESDYTEEVRSFLASTLGVTAFHSSSALRKTQTDSKSSY